jgi:hypothetical protein
MTTKRLLVIVAVSIVAAGPLGGFIFGFITCDDCGWNVFGRAFIGCVMAVITPLSGGFPPQNEGGVGAPFNAWPHIAGAGIVVFAILFYRERRKRKRE